MISRPAAAISCACRARSVWESLPVKLLLHVSGSRAGVGAINARVCSSATMPARASAWPTATRTTRARAAAARRSSPRSGSLRYLGGDLRCQRRNKSRQAGRSKTRPVCGVDAENDAPRPPRRRWQKAARAPIGFLISGLNPAQYLIRMAMEPRRSCLALCPGTRLASI